MVVGQVLGGVLEEVVSAQGGAAMLSAAGRAIEADLLQHECAEVAARAEQVSHSLIPFFTPSWRFSQSLFA